MTMDIKRIMWLLLLLQYPIIVISQQEIDNQSKSISEADNTVFASVVSSSIERLIRRKTELITNKSSFDNDLDLRSNECTDMNVWFVKENDSCACGSNVHDAVMCDKLSDVLAVIDCYCITYFYDDQEEPFFPVVGRCIFNCMNVTRGKTTPLFHPAPSNCASLNRQGTLCGQCMDGYAVPAYSYEFKCIKCNDSLENWGLYIAFAFLPLTGFIIIMFIFRINVLAPELYMFVYAAQNVSTPALLKIVFNYISSVHSPLDTISMSILLTLYGIWNLDFLRVNVLPDVCINATPIQILVLDYLVAIYPMLLMAVAYTLVEIHSFGHEAILCMWRPFHWVLARFRQHWGIRTTIMDLFVTFFFLSTTKLLSVSFSVLISTTMYTSTGKAHSMSVYYDPSITYFGLQHLPYALLALTILTFLIFLPTSLLLFYQCRPYRKCIERLRINGDTLNSFLETFQKYYKNGENGTRDCRWFAGFFILFKCSIYLVYSLSLSDIGLVFITIIGIIAAIVVVIVEPYREEYWVFNIISANLFLWHSFFACHVARESLSLLVESKFKGNFVLVYLIWMVPLVYGGGMLLKYIIVKLRRRRMRSASSLLPHRLLHSEQYRNV